MPRDLITLYGTEAVSSADWNNRHLSQLDSNDPRWSPAAAGRRQCFDLWHDKWESTLRKFQFIKPKHALERYSRNNDPSHFTNDEEVEKLTKAINQPVPPKPTTEPPSVNLNQPFFDPIGGGEGEGI